MLLTATFCQKCVTHSLSHSNCYYLIFLSCYLLSYVFLFGEVPSCIKCFFTYICIRMRGNSMHKLQLRMMIDVSNIAFVFIMASKRVLKCLSIEEKYKLIKEVDGGLKKKEAAAKYGIPASTVSTIFKNKESIITSFESGVRLSCKRMKTPKFHNIDKAVLDWFTTARNQNMPISGGILKEKAMEFSKRFGDDNFMASTGWLDKWKQRY